MKTWVRKSLSVGVLAAGAVLFGQSVAHADVVSTGNYGIGTGTQVFAPVQTILNVCGNSVSAVGGVAFAGCEGGAEGSLAGAGSLTSTDNYGILTGTQIYAPIQTIINTCGTSVGAAGSVTDASCTGGASGTIGGEDGDPDGGPDGGYESTKVAEKAKAHGKKAKKSKSMAGEIVSSGNYGILTGTQIYAPIQTVINTCGTSLGAAGSVSSASCEGGAGGTQEGAGGASLMSTNNYGVGSGTQIFAPVQTVTNISSTAVAGIGGVAFADSVGGAWGTQESAGGVESLWSSDNYGVGTGTQVFAPVQTIVEVSGNAIAGVGAVAFADSVGGAWGN